MQREFMSREGQIKGLILDPRTKLLLILMISVFVLGGAGGLKLFILRPILSFIPFVMLVTSGRVGQGMLYALAYSTCYFAQIVLLPEMTGMGSAFILIMSGAFCRFLPGFVTAYFFVSTTTVSEFMAAMERMHIPDKITIPLSVVFRFTPTVMEEANAIGDAMKMRGIGIFGRKRKKLFEYRIIPMITCSAKIGDNLSQAALTRGLGAPVKRTNICNIGFGFWDAVIICICILVVVWSIAYM
ncbi:MAG: energy-coupling factor transporter transmembrane protein EcfT [Lachnospiraceae bacterium]|nr:energy-coupling factor transporter transmembrane protein EcfT [Lachnospiraceae bacterium]